MLHEPNLAALALEETEEREFPLFRLPVHMGRRCHGCIMERAKQTLPAVKVGIYLPTHALEQEDPTSPAICPLKSGLFISRNHWKQSLYSQFT